MESWSNGMVGTPRHDADALHHRRAEWRGEDGKTKCLKPDETEPYEKRFLEDLDRINPAAVPVA